jgi:dTDP-4-amino-4,6-dideoxygalactose transaminase
MALSTTPVTRPSADHRQRGAVAEVPDSGRPAGPVPRGTRPDDGGVGALAEREHAVALNDCAAALDLGLAALGVGRGDEVLVADHGVPATGRAVLRCAATPVFVDVRPDTGTMDPALVAALITPRTVGILAADALGVPADWDPLLEVARRHGLFLFEDAAGAAGASYRDRPCGAFGDASVLSLPAHAGSTGVECGLLTTDDAVLAKTVRGAARLTDVLADVPAAGIASARLGPFDADVPRRRALAGRYAALLVDLPGIDAPSVPADRLPSWHTYAVTVDPELDRDALAAALRERGVTGDTGTYALHRCGAFRADRDACPVSADLADRRLALPMRPDLTGAEQDRVVESLAEAVAES